MEPMMEDSKEQIWYGKNEGIGGIGIDFNAEMSPEVPGEKINIHVKQERVESEAGSDVDKQIAKMTTIAVGSDKTNITRPTCLICGKTFAQNHNLEKHMLLHTGEKPYQCPACPVAVRQHVHLEKHMKIHHPRTPIPPYKNNITNKAKRRIPKVKRKTTRKNLGRNLQSLVKTEVDYDNGTAATLGSYVKQELEESETGGFDDDDGRNWNGTDKTDTDDDDVGKNKKHQGNSKGTTCPKCGKHFRQRSNMLTHLLVHTGVKPYKCPACPMGFRQYSHLQIHMGKYHIGVPVPVYRNQRFTALKIPEKEPKSKIDPDKKSKLRDCKVKMKRWDLENDDDDNQINTSLTFQKFNSIVSRREGLDLPLQVEANDGTARNCVVNVDVNLLAHFLQPIYSPPPAPASGKITVGMYLNKFFPNHYHPLSSHTSPSAVKMEKPGQKNKTGGGGPKVKMEMNPSYLDRKLECDKCNMKFLHQRSLYLHKQRNHSNVRNKSGIQFNGNTISPEGNKPDGAGVYECTICGRKFKRLDIWKKHMELHSGGNKSHQCSTCFKCFKTPNYLIVHMRSHTGERPFVCKICGRGFTQTSALNMHMRLHTGEKPYACPQCGLQFAQSSSLDSHVRSTHSGEIDCYRCHLCGATFSNIDSLNMHSASSHY